MAASLSRRIAAGFGLGHAGFAPGTVASAAALLAGLPLGRALGPAALLASVAGWAAIRRLPEIGEDPSWVVVDEIAGQWITMLGLPRNPTPLQLGAAFALFRTLDIAKPGPVGWADRQRGPFGVMADDIIAGAIGAALLRIVVRRR